MSQAYAMFNERALENLRMQMDTNHSHTSVAIKVRGFLAAEPSPSSSPWLESARSACAWPGECRREGAAASSGRLVMT